MKCPNKLFVYNRNLPFNINVSKNTSKKIGKKRKKHLPTWGNVGRITHTHEKMSTKTRKVKGK